MSAEMQCISLLFRALSGLLYRHNDGSDEKYWAEWDVATEALKKTKRLLGIAPQTEE